MKKIYVFLKDIQRDAVFYLIITLQLVFMLIFGTYAITDIGVFNQPAIGFLDMYEEAYLLQKEDVSDLIGGDDFLLENVGYSFRKNIGEKQVSIVNPLITKMLTVKHSGDWFEEYNSNDKYKQAILLYSAKEVYPVGTELNIGTNYDPYFIRVIGHMGENDTAIDISGGPFRSNFSEGKVDMMICDNTLPDKSFGTIFVNSEKLMSHFTLNYGVRSFYAIDAYYQYYDAIRDDVVFNNYLTMSMIIIFTLAICGYSVFRNNTNTKRNAIKHLVGQSRSYFVVSELIKALWVFILPFLISTFVILTANSTLFSLSVFMILSSIIFAIYSFVTVLVMTRVLLAKPLNELKKQ